MYKMGIYWGLLKFQFFGGIYLIFEIFFFFWGGGGGGKVRASVSRNVRITPLGLFISRINTSVSFEAIKKCFTILPFKSN